MLTGVSFDVNKLGTLTYDIKEDKVTYYFTQKVPVMFHGTGDCFASALSAAITKGKSLADSSKIAVDFTVDSILETIKYPNIDKKYGVCFEEALHKLIGEIKWLE